MLDTGRILPGFQDPVLDAQQVFMASLRALAYPGSVMDLPVLPAGPKPLYASTTAILLTLLDRETPVWLDPSAGNGNIRDWLAFHCGCPPDPNPARAHFALVTDGLNLPDLNRFNCGGEDCPELSATVIVQVQGLAPEGKLRLSGPGIQNQAGLTVEGLDQSFWTFLEMNGRLYPQGLDFLLVAPGSVCGLPRTTRAAA